jgi:hypothetical protein
MTRSPCGPKANGPGSPTPKRHDRRFVLGSSAHARPSATNATVWLAMTFPWQPRGSGEPSASVAPLGGSETVELWESAVG